MIRVGGEKSGWTLFFTAAIFAVFGQYLAALALREIDQIGWYDFDTQDESGNLAVTLQGVVLAAQFITVLLYVARSKAANIRMFFSVLFFSAALAQFIYWGFSLACSLYGECM